MAHRPYPNADRALRNLRHQQAVYQYGRVPQRWVMAAEDGLTERVTPYPVDEYRLSTR